MENANVSWLPGRIEFKPDFSPADAIKSSIPTVAKLDKSRGVWVLPPLYSSIVTLRNLFKSRIRLTDDAELRASLSAGFPVTRHAYTTGRDGVEFLPFQAEAADFLVSSPLHGSLLSLSPGLGKTLTALTAALTIGAERVLIVAPLSLTKNWLRELQYWKGIEGSRRWGLAPDSNRFTITNFETVANMMQAYAQKWDLVIVDESILVKNYKTKRSAALKLVGSKASKVWLLSGSPTSKYADDLFSQFQILEPNAFTSYWRFTNHVCYVTEEYWGTVISGTKESFNPQEDFKDLMFVRHQKDVLDLPPILFETISTDLTPRQQEIYTQMMRSFLVQLDSGERIRVTAAISQLLKLRQIISTPRNLDPELPPESGKLDVLRSLIEVENVEFPCLIWIKWRGTAEVITQALRSAFPKLAVDYINGSIHPDLRERILDRYKSGQLPILIMGEDIGKYGFTLTNTRTIIRYDTTYDADAYIQSIHRVHRLGLTHSPRMISLITEGTIDELSINSLEVKFESIAKVSNADLAALLRSLDR